PQGLALAQGKAHPVDRLDQSPAREDVGVEVVHFQDDVADLSGHACRGQASVVGRPDPFSYLAGGLISSKCVERPAARPGYTHCPTNFGLAMTSLANQNIGMSANSSKRWSAMERASFWRSWGFTALVRAA